MLDGSWNSGDHYERYVGRWSRRVAEKFLPALDVPAGARWLDVGCGSGALTAAILHSAAPALVKSYDSSPFFIDYARNNVSDPRAQFYTGDAHALPEGTDSHDAVVSGLVLNFLADPLRAVVEWARVAAPGGKIAAYVWDYAGEMQFMRIFWDAAISLDPEAAELDEGVRFPLCQPGPLGELFRNAGLENVEVLPIDIETRFQDFDDYWKPFLGGQGPAPGYVASLSAERRNELRDLIRDRLPVEADGGIPLIARAWAVKSLVS
jgi:SAM-dependent methyltransferase